MAKGKPELNEMVLTQEMKAFAEAAQAPVVEAKKQVPLRLTPTVIARVTTLAGRKTAASGVRVTNQDLMERAVLDFLTREGG